jgi:hypothetical protein
LQATYKQQKFMRLLKQQHPIAWNYAAKGLPSIDSMSKQNASKAIDKLSAFVVYNPGSQRAKIAEILREQGMNEHVAIEKIRPMVGQKPLLWSRNSNGTRIPLPIGEQRDRMKETVRAVRQEMMSKPEIPTGDFEGEGSESDQGGEDEPDWMREMREAMEDSEGQESECAEGSEGDEDEEESEGEGETESMTEEQRKRFYARQFLQFVRQSRDYWVTRNADGITAESIGMRPSLNGAKMIRAGIPVDAAKHAMGIHWPAGTIDEIQTVKPRKKARSPKPDEHPATAYGQDRLQELSTQVGESVHVVLPYVLTLAEARVPIALIGTHGTGKTEIARQLASVMGLRFGFASMTEGTPPSTFYGRVFPEHVQSVFEDCYLNGGVFLFDEMDAAHPNLLLIVNAALANGHFSNTATGETITVHRDFVPVCAMNTVGLGADRNYTGRKRLDAAALDRWHMGRVQVPIDEHLEEKLYFSLLGDSSDELESIPTADEPHEPTADELEDVFQPEPA